MPNAVNSGQQSASASHFDRPELQPPPVSDDTDHQEYQNNEQPRAEHPSDYRPQLEDIPELEDNNEENWEEGQFTDTDFNEHYNYNRTEESDKIHHEYSAHFKKVREQGNSSYHSTTSEFKYQILEPEYYNSDTQLK